MTSDRLPHQVANLHRATVKAALEIVGALGVESPSMVSGKHLYRRDSGTRSPQP
jgi:glutamate synthase domain-containing protein 2